MAVTAEPQRYCLAPTESKWKSSWRSRRVRVGPNFAGVQGLSVKAGRQYVIFGNHSLFGHFDWANTGYSHDGIMLQYSTKAWDVYEGGSAILKVIYRRPLQSEASPVRSPVTHKTDKTVAAMPTCSSSITRSNLCLVS